MAEQKNNHEGINVEDALSQSEAFIVKHKSLIIGIVVALVVIIAGVMLYKNYISEPNEKKAAAAIFRGEEYFGEGRYQEAISGDSLGFVGLIKLADEYSSTKSGKLAKAYIGISYAKLGQYQEAVKYLESFNGKDLMVGPAALGTLGESYANLNQLDKATSTLLKAADQADNNTLSPIYLIKAGEIFESQGKYNDAVKAYTKVKEKYFNSYQAMDIDKYIERANAGNK